MMVNSIKWLFQRHSNALRHRESNQGFVLWVLDWQCWWALRFNYVVNWLFWRM